MNYAAPSGSAISTTRRREIVVLWAAHENHDSPALPEVLARINRSGVTRHLDRLMGYRILSQNSSPTPRAMRPVIRPEVTSPEPPRTVVPELDELWQRLMSVGLPLGTATGGWSGTQLPEVP